MKIASSTIRYLIFTAVLLSATVPLLFNIHLSQTISPESENVFRAIDSLSAGRVVMISFDFEAATFAEIKPMAEALIKHAFRKNLRIIGLSLFAEGTALGEQTLRRHALEAHKQYGADYVYLGYRPQYMSAMLAMAESIVQEYPVDYTGDSTSVMPIFAGVTNYADVSAVISIADGGMPGYWVQFVVTKYDVSLLTAVTATMATSYYPFLSSGQIRGMLSGLKGAAEYEQASGDKAGGGRGLFAQSFSQIVIVAIILVANVSELVRRKKR